MTAAIELVEQSFAVELVQPVAAVEIVQAASTIELAEPGADLELVEASTVVELVAGPTIELVEQSTVLELGNTALQGPPGADGSGGGGSSDLTYPAAVTVSGQRVVLYDPIAGGWIYADRTIPAHAGAQLAVTVGAIMAAASGAARISGVLDEPTWSWPAPCSLWLDTVGQLTATPPTAGFLREVARAVTPTRIVIEPEPAIALAA
jgi:hypothetical protein